MKRSELIVKVSKNINYDIAVVESVLCGITDEIICSLKKGDSVSIMIGPEGGFERAEVEQAMEAGAKPITLGKRILRTETAGLTILSILMFELED